MNIIPLYADGGGGVTPGTIEGTHLRWNSLLSVWEENQGVKDDKITEEILLTKDVGNITMQTALQNDLIKHTISDNVTFSNSSIQNTKKEIFLRFSDLEDVITPDTRNASILMDKTEGIKFEVEDRYNNFAISKINFNDGSIKFLKSDDGGVTFTNKYAVLDKYTSFNTNVPFSSYGLSILNNNKYLTLPTNLNNLDGCFFMSNIGITGNGATNSFVFGLVQDYDVSSFNDVYSFGNLPPENSTHRYPQQYMMYLQHTRIGGRQCRGTALLNGATTGNISTLNNTIVINVTTATYTLNFPNSSGMIEGQEFLLILRADVATTITIRTISGGSTNGTFVQKISSTPLLSYNIILAIGEVFRQKYIFTDLLNTQYSLIATDGVFFEL